MDSVSPPFACKGRAVCTAGANGWARPGLQGRAKALRPMRPRPLRPWRRGWRAGASPAAPRRRRRTTPCQRAHRQPRVCRRRRQNAGRTPADPRQNRGGGAGVSTRSNSCALAGHERGRARPWPTPFAAVAAAAVRRRAAWRRLPTPARRVRPVRAPPRSEDYARPPPPRPRRRAGRRRALPTRRKEMRRRRRPVLDRQDPIGRTVAEPRQKRGRRRPGFASKSDPGTPGGWWTRGRACPPCRFFFPPPLARATAARQATPETSTWLTHATAASPRKQRANTAGRTSSSSRQTHATRLAVDFCTTFAQSSRRRRREKSNRLLFERKRAAIFFSLERAAVDVWRPHRRWGRLRVCAAVVWRSGARDW